MELYFGVSALHDVLARNLSIVRIININIRSSYPIFDMDRHRLYASAAAHNRIQNHADTPCIRIFTLISSVGTESQEKIRLLAA